MDLRQNDGFIFRFGLFEADPAESLLTRNGVRTKIQDQPFRVLILLLQRPGEIVTREELRQGLWPEGTHVDYDGSLNVILKRLRAAIDDDSDNPRFIETVPRRGYRFIAPVSIERAKGVAAGLHEAPAQNPPADPASATPDMPRTEDEEAYAAPAPVSPQRSHPARVYVAAALIALSITVAAWFYWQRRSLPQAAATGSKAPAVMAPVRKSVAVLGFHNVTNTPEEAWLGTAFSEMLSTELEQGGTLRLVSEEDVANLRGSSPWPQADTLDPKTTARIATALNCDFVVLGSYATVGRPGKGQLRVDVHLQDARTGEILTGIAEAGGIRDVFDLVSRTGRRLRDRLGAPKLDEPAEASVLASLPSNPEAARMYSLGLVRMREYDYQSAHGLFLQAIKADPEFPLSYSMAARVDILLGHEDEAKAEARRGLDLSGGLSRVQRMEIEATYYQVTADRAKAAEIFKVLFDMFPDSLDYGLQLAKLQQESYQPDAALKTIRQLRSLPPPARDDPGLDSREGGIVLPRDADLADRLFLSSAAKASAQGKTLAYARAERALCWTNRRHLQAPPQCKEAYDAFLAAGNRDAAGDCLQLMAEANRQTGHDQEAIPLYEQAMGLFKEAGDREQVGVALNNMSLALERQGQWSRAEQGFRDAKVNFQSLNDKANSADALNNIADILVMRGRLSEAADIYRQTWELIDSSGRARSDSSHVQHASVLFLQGQLEPAKQEIDAQTASLRAYTADPWTLADALTARGNIDVAQGEMEAARKAYQEAADLLKKANSPAGAIQISFAELSIAEGRPDAAEAQIRKAIEQLEQEHDTKAEVAAHTSLGRALLAQGKAAEAQDALGRGGKLADLREFPLYALPLKVLQAKIDAAKARFDGKAGDQSLGAAQALRAAIQQAHRLELYSIECEARLSLGEIELTADPAARAGLIALGLEARTRGFKSLAQRAQSVAARNISR